MKNGIEMEVLMQLNGNNGKSNILETRLKVEDGVVNLKMELGMQLNGRIIPKVLKEKEVMVALKEKEDQKEKEVQEALKASKAQKEVKVERKNGKNQKILMVLLTYNQLISQQQP